MTKRRDDIMFKVGNVVLLKQGLKLVRGVIISVDTDFISVDIKYNRGKGTILKVRKDSKELINLDFTTKEIFKGDTLPFKNDMA
jgi:hypothetical protein